MALLTPPLQPSSAISIRDVILHLFPAPRRSNTSLRKLAILANSATSATTLDGRLDGVVALLNFTRISDRTIVDPLDYDPATSGLIDDRWKRNLVWSSILQASPDILARYQACVESILRETDGLNLFANSGLPSDRGLFSETSERLIRILLPSPREDADLSKLFSRVFPSRREVDRFFDAPPEVFNRFVALAAPPPDSDSWNSVTLAMVDAFCLLGARVQGLGLSEKIRARSRAVSVQDSPFYRLTHSVDALARHFRNGGETASAAIAWREDVVDCRAEMQTIVANLDSNGVHLDSVYALDVIRQSLARMEFLAAVLLASPGEDKKHTAKRLLREVVRGRVADRSLFSLAHNSFRLLARKIVEWAGKTGEHYITTDRKEYFHMWRAALGGGLLTVGTAAIKMVVTHSDLPLFFEGFLSGLNYAVSFILLQNFHLVLATKQPSMTGATLARIVHRCQDNSRSEELATFVARILRSQLAAAFGNIFAVAGGCVVFTLIWDRIFPNQFLTHDVALHNLESLHPFFSGTIFFAALTGVILWLSSLVGGWIENWAVYHRLPLAIAEHRLGAALKPATLQKISDSLSRNISGWGGNIALGFMLGMTPPLSRFFGLHLDVRHVTLSSGTVALGAASLGREAFENNTLLWAAIGIAFTFVLNLTVSFALALWLAMRAQDVTPQDHLAIARTLWHRFLQSPKEFFLPPPTERPADPPADILADGRATVSADSDESAVAAVVAPLSTEPHAESVTGSDLPVPGHS